MDSNSVSVMLGCAGLLVGSIGLVAEDIRSADQRATIAEPLQQTQTSAWPPHPLAAGVEFHDEMVKLINVGPSSQPPRDNEGQDARARQQPQETNSVPREGSAAIREIRVGRMSGAARVQFIEIEFVDSGGRAYRRVFPVERPQLAVQPGDIEANQPAMETYGYSPRRSRRSRRWR